MANKSSYEFGGYAGLYRARKALYGQTTRKLTLIDYGWLTEGKHSAKVTDLTDHGSSWIIRFTELNGTRVIDQKVWPYYKGSLSQKMAGTLRAAGLSWSGCPTFEEIKEALIGEPLRVSIGWTDGYHLASDGTGYVIQTLQGLSLTENSFNTVEGARTWARKSGLNQAYLTVKSTALLPLSVTVAKPA